MGSKYEAAVASWNYNDGVGMIQWYLPSAGELGFIRPRFNAINTSVLSLEGSSVLYGWSSTECAEVAAITFSGSEIAGYTKNSYTKARPFAMI